MIIKRVCFAIICMTTLIITSVVVLPAFGSSGEASVAEGQALPDFKMEMTLSPEMVQYLGLKPDTEFTLGQIHSNLIVIEVLSALCQECHKNAPRVNKLYNIISNDSGLNATVKMMGIAVGNDTKLVDVYKNTYNVKFPIIADPKDDINKRLGNMSTPSIIVADNKGVVLFIHEGLIHDMDEILDIIRTYQSQ